MAVAGGGLVLLISIWFRWHEGSELGFLVGYEGVTNAALMAAVILLGESVRVRRLSAEQAETIRMLERERLATEATIRLENERTAVARDLHDIVGHALSVISIQTAVAEENLPEEAEVARSAVALSRSTAVQSMAELRSLLRQLRADRGEAVTGVASLDNLDPLVERIRRTGLAVTLVSEIKGDELPRSVDVTAYRIIQEGLTNATKHADASLVTVTIDSRPEAVDIAVEDDGVGPPSTHATGQGLNGIAERVRLIGGTLTTGQGPGGGYRIQVSLPLGPTP